MDSIAGYPIKQVLFESQQSVIYRCLHKKEKRTVILKALKGEFPTPLEVARYRREYDILRSLDIVGIIRAEALEVLNNRLIIVMEDFGGDSLRHLLARVKTDIRTFLRLAIRIADILALIHRNNIIHKDINPTNIIWNPKTDVVKIIDFGISARISNEKPELFQGDSLDGTLAYLSPEQTGRMNRMVDYRADFYSLGVTFYEMLTGFRPFRAVDPMEMVHNHIAVKPAPPDQAVAELCADGACADDIMTLQGIVELIPPVLSNIVLKLMAKSAEERYQGAFGLKVDLMECLEQLEKYGSIRSFNIGKKDVSDRFDPSQKLYGREKEIETLLSVYDSICAGASEILLVGGVTGVGKSALINEVHKPIVKRRGLFAEGKYDQFQRNVPYSAIIKAFRSLIQQILNQPELEFKRWRREFLNALGPNSQLIIQIIPEFEHLIGHQPPIRDLNPTEAQNRFLITFANFVRIFARREHPLTIFLDDLQWCDKPSLNLLERLLLTRDIGYFLIIGAFRDNEVGVSHPLALTLEEITRVKSIQRLTIKSLDRDTVTRLIADALHCQPAEVGALADLIFQKTDGNPFFANELLKNLYKRKLICFDPNLGEWRWDSEKIQSVEVSDNVVEFILQRLQELSAETLQTLQLASCIGPAFDFKVLAAIAERDPAAIAANLWEAINHGVLTPLNSEYRLLHAWRKENNEPFPNFTVFYQFQHDRIHQAAYSLIAENKKSEIHLKIGRLLWKHSLSDNPVETIIEIVRHLNLGIPVLTDGAEKVELARMNLSAGKSAQASSAYSPAFEYFSNAKNLLPPDGWESFYSLSFEIMRRFAETAYLCGRFDVGEEACAVLIGQAGTPMAKAEIREMQASHYTYLSRLDESIRAGIQGLRHLGVKLSPAPTVAAILREIALTKWLLRGKTPQMLLEQSIITDPETKLKMKLLIDFIPPAYLSNQKNLFAVAVLKKTNISILSGNCPESAPAYIGYAILLAGLGNLKGAYEFGKLAINLNEKFDDLEWRSLVYTLYALFCHSWSEHWSTLPRWFKKTIEAGLQAGDLMYTAYACVYVNIWNPTIDLETAISQQEKYISLAEETKNQDALDSARLVCQRWLAFCGRTNDRFSFSDSLFNETACINRMKDAKFLSGVAIFYIYKLHVHYMFGDYPTALEYLEECDQVIEALQGSPFMEEYCIYGFLTLAACFPGMSGVEKRRAMKRMKKEYRRMRKWAEYCPINFSHHQFLMDAELARLRGHNFKAIQSYQLAIKAAEENDFLRYRALTCELAGRFYVEKNQERLAGVYLRDAHYYYSAWGAHGKVKFLEEEYPDLAWSGVNKPLMEIVSPESPTPSDTGGHQRLDLSTVLKFSQTISREINLTELLKKIMRIVIENAGAQRGFLILKHEDKWCITAEGGADNKISPVYSIECIDDSSRIAQSVLQFVIRTGENMVLRDAANDERFAFDPYIIRHHPKSLLCAPMFNQGKMTGVWYLENNLVFGAFTEERLGILEMLSYQIAISIENAMVYGELEELNKTLEQKVDERTRQLHEKNNQIMDSINYAQVIQSSILPKDEKIRKHLSHHFIIWRPRDIVGGDFWWFESFEDKYLIAVADCTGHGVPGALMTMTASSVLARVVEGGFIDNPARILKELNVLMRASLNQDLNSTLSDDGMDIGICCIIPRLKKLIYAGARIPLYWRSADGQIHIIKGARQSIGYKRSKEDFQYPEHEIPTEDGAVFYLTTDGFIHQNGGDKDLSFGRNRFKRLLSQNSHLSLNEQKERLESELKLYQAAETQRDDITLLGFKI